jgi:hypothetical protein
VSQFFRLAHVFKLRCESFNQISSTQRNDGALDCGRDFWGIVGEEEGQVSRDIEIRHLVTPRISGIRSMSCTNAWLLRDPVHLRSKQAFDKTDVKH